MRRTFRVRYDTVSIRKILEKPGINWEDTEKVYEKLPYTIIHINFESTDRSRTMLSYYGPAVSGRHLHIFPELAAKGADE